MNIVTSFDTLEGLKTYRVKNIQHQELEISGAGADPHWGKATELADFTYPWEKKNASCTTFKALHSTNWLFCLFKVRAANVNVFERTHEKSEILKSDRVELFLKKDNHLSTYYCLEIDPLARVYDYEAHYHRNFNTDWSWPSGQLLIKTGRDNDGYTVEVAIHKNSLCSLGLLHGDVIEAGLYRAECAAIQEDRAEMKWISWIKPDSATPDFHIASSFGVLQLEN